MCILKDRVQENDAHKKEQLSCKGFQREVEICEKKDIGQIVAKRSVVRWTHFDNAIAQQQLLKFELVQSLYANCDVFGDFQLRS